MTRDRDSTASDGSHSTAIDVPASYAEYASDVTDPRFTDWLRARTEPKWTAAVTHPFTRELGAGTLEEDDFVEYLLQDYVFVDSLVSAFGYAVGTAPGVAEKRPLIEFLDTITDDENDYFVRSFDALGVSASRRSGVEPTATTAAFVDLLARASREGGYAETLAVLVPAEWIYEQWATSVAAEYGALGERDTPSAGTDLPFYYAEWIDLHAVSSFVEFVDWLRGQLDAHGPELSNRREARVERFFRRTVEYEAAFFDAAHDSGDGD